MRHYYARGKDTTKNPNHQVIRRKNINQKNYSTRIGLHFAANCIAFCRIMQRDLPQNATRFAAK
jgi:hypothetical protein